jgi:hypothetical protein
MKSKRTFLIIFLLLLSIVSFQSIAHADTEVGREITTNTTWTLAGSPYIVTQNILVNAGVTLTIEPGVTVKLNATLDMIIDGKLVARGTKDNMITFTSSSPNPSTTDYWGAIRFNQSSPVATFDANGNYLEGSILEYCIAEYGSQYGNGHQQLEVFYADETSPFINFCIVRNCMYGGIHINNGNYQIINPNTGKIIYKHPDLKTTRITNNTLNDSGPQGGITMWGDSMFCSNNIITKAWAGIYAGGVNHIITGNTIREINNGASGRGIVCTSYSVFSGTSASYEVSHNTISDFKGIAIFADGAIGSLNIFGNTIENITFGIEGQGGPGDWGAGVVIYGNIDASPKNVFIQYNTFSNNINISPAGLAGAIYGDGAITIEHNCFINNQTKGYPFGSNMLYITGNSKINYNNFESSTSGYDIYNGNNYGGQTKDIDATNNYWGTTDEKVIQSKIFDYFVNTQYSKVNYSPFLTAPVSCDPNTAITTTTTIPGAATTVPVNTTTTISEETTTTIPVDTTTTTEPSVTTTTTTQPGTCEIRSIQPSGITVGFGILPRIKTITVSLNVDLEEAGITAGDLTFENAPKGVTILSTQIIGNRIEAVVLFWGVTPGTYNVNLGQCGSIPFVVLRF